MQNKLLLLIVVLLSIIYVDIRSTKHTSIFNEQANNIIIKDIENNTTINLDIEEYLIGVLAGEMPASFNDEALKAQAVASRTYAYYKIINSTKDYDITNDKSSQVYLNYEQMQVKWDNDYDKYLSKIKKAILDTKGQVLTYNNSVICSYYFAMSNGYTEDSIYVFGENQDYLKSTISEEDTDNHNFEVIKVISKEEFCNALNINCLNIEITNVSRTNSNRIDTITINNNNFKGTEIRKLLDLRSTDFYIDFQDNDIYITTYGYGHGVGMSQYGANYMANNGSSYEEILKHYYNGTELYDINTLNII